MHIVHFSKTMNNKLIIILSQSESLTYNIFLTRDDPILFNISYHNYTCNNFLGFSWILEFYNVYYFSATITAIGDHYVNTILKWVNLSLCSKILGNDCSASWLMFKIYIWNVQQCCLRGICMMLSWRLTLILQWNTFFFGTFTWICIKLFIIATSTCISTRSYD